MSGEVFTRQNLKRYALIAKQLAKWILRNILNIFIILYFLAIRRIPGIRSIFYREVIALQNIFSSTRFYWQFLDSQYSSDISVYKEYVAKNSYDVVYGRQVDFLVSLERVIRENDFDSIVAEQKHEELTWVMSTGRCGVDAIDRYFKMSEAHNSVHREFYKDEKYYEFKSTWTTKSYELSKIFYNNATDEEIKSIITGFLERRMKTIRRRGEKRWVFCEHVDTVWLPIILRIFPSSKIVFLFKNPQDVITSYMSKQLYTSAQEMPLSRSQDKLEFKTLFGLMCWFHTYINMYINIHCDLIEDDRRILRINGSDLFRKDPSTHSKLNDFMSMQTPLEKYNEHFSGRYNSQLRRAELSQFPRQENWPDSYNELLNLFSSQIDRNIRH